MRIAIDASRAVTDQRTGTERYSLELLRALLRLGPGEEFWLYFNQPPPDGLLPPGPHWRARVIPQRRLWTHLRLSRALLRDRPDLLFVPAHVLPIVHPSRSVVTVHDLGFHFFPRAHPPLARLYLELSTRWAARRATRLIAISHCTARDLERVYGVPRERIRVVYEGVDSRFRPVLDAAQLTALERRYGLTPGGYFLAVGTLQPRKNLIGLLQAYRRYREAASAPLPLALAGRAGWGLGPIEAEIARLGLGPWLRRLGYVPDEDLPVLYSAALAYLQPSLYEGFGLTVLEALACGTPAIVSNSSALPEVAGAAALLIDPRRPEEIAAAMLRLHEEPGLRAALAAAGPAQAARFSWERCARETLAVLREAAG